MMRNLSWILFQIRYKLGLARDGVDFVTPGLSADDSYCDDTRLAGDHKTM